jgi:hypothetical protein
MINVVDRTISLGDKVVPIQAWQVWWRTPFGLHRGLGDAVAAVREGEMDPRHTVVPVAVAVGDDGTTYEEMPR